MSKVNRRRPIHRKKRHKIWQLQEAKARFSELVNEVVEEGYQTITKNGQPVAVVISLEEFKKLKTPLKSLGEVVTESPFTTFHVEIEKSEDLGREIDL